MHKSLGRIIGNERGSSGTQVAILGGLVVLAIIMLALIGGYLSTNSQSVEAEAGIIAQAQTCQQGIDIGFQQILGVAAVDQQFQENMRNLFETIFSSNDAGVQQDATSGLTMYLVGAQVLAGTDFSQTPLQVQRVIESTYANIGSCMGGIADRKRAYSGILGIPAGALPGQNGEWPNAMYASFLGLPRHLDPNGETAPHRDLDGDGFYTVFDYPSVISIGGFGADAFENGEVTPVAIYPTDTP